MVPLSGSARLIPFNTMTDYILPSQYRKPVIHPYLASVVLTREKRNNPPTQPIRRENVSQARVFDPWHIIETIGYVVVDAPQSDLRGIYMHVLSILLYIRVLSSLH